MIVNFRNCFTLLLLLAVTLSADTFKKDILPLVDKYCFKCHDEDVQKGDIRLDQTFSEEDVVKQRKLWLRVLEQLEVEEMPPKKPFPSDAELAGMIKWLDKTLHHYDWSKVKNPGYVSLSRLTNQEYKNSVRDLFGIDFHKASAWVKDPEGDSGFTNDRDDLSISINSMNRYLFEAEEYVDGLISYRNKPWGKTFDIQEGKGKMSDGSKSVDLKYETNPHRLDMTFPFTGLYKLTVRAASKGQPLTGMRVMLNGKKVFGQTITGNAPKEYTIPVFARKGFSTLMIYISKEDASLYTDDRITFPTPKEVLNKIRKASKSPPQLKIPDKYRKDKKIVDAFKKVNKVAARCYSAKQAALIFMKMKKMPDDQEPVRGLLKGSVPTNINNGRLAVLLGISTKQIFKKWKDETGEDFGVDFSEYRKIREAYRKKYNEQYGHRKQTMGVLQVDKLSFTGPYLPEGSEDPSPVLKSSSDLAGASKVLNFYMSKAFRKNITSEELKPFLNVYSETAKETGDHFEALRDSLVALLISPKFLMHRNEIHKGTELDQYQIAARISYFLWQSLPDKELLQLAAAKKLNNPEIVKAQIERLLKDERFAIACKSFTAEWLDLQNIQGVSDKLKEAMQKEPQLVMQRIFKENRSIFELIDADYTYLNELLARHYDIENVKGFDMRLVKLNSGKRGGLLTMGSMLSATSLPSRTSPVQRGSWIVETILGEELPPPPDGVPELPANAGKGAKTLRQELEIHRQDPKCSGCHSRIDPYGFVLENYDKIGRWRDKAGKKKIDSKMKLKSGETCSDVVSFKQHLLTSRKDDIRRNLVQRVLSFALGRKLYYYDEPAILKIIEKVKSNGDKAHSLVEAVVESYPFTNQMIQEEE